MFYLCFNLCFTYVLTYVLLMFNLCFDEAHEANLLIRTIFVRSITIDLLLLLLLLLHFVNMGWFETCSWADQLSGLVSNSSAQIYYRSRDDRFLVNERRMQSVGTLGTSNAL